MKLINKDNKVDIYPNEVEYINNKNKNEIRKQNIIIISNNNMIKSLSKDNAKFFGIDSTYKIIPNVINPIN